MYVRSVYIYFTVPTRVIFNHNHNHIFNPMCPTRSPSTDSFRLHFERRLRFIMSLLPPSYLLTLYSNRSAFLHPAPLPYVHEPRLARATCPRRHTISHPVALAASSKKPKNTYAPTTINRPARFRYQLLQTYECGIELLGTEVKAVRDGRLNLRDGFARVKDAQLYLHNVHIGEWTQSHRAFNHEPLRVRRLLLHKRMIRKLAGEQTDSGVTLIPTRAYFSSNGYLKVEIALARGKQTHDKRETIKKRDNERDLRRAIKQVVMR